MYLFKILICTKGVYECLLEDNKTCQLSIRSRLNLEALISEKVNNNPNHQWLDQVYSANLVRLITESHSFQAQHYNIERLNYLGQVNI
jgi:hypothetical protein